jgi:hypothetical protein
MRIGAIAMGAVVTAALALLLTGLGAGSTSKRHAALRLVQASPIQVRGTGFHARERVRVVASAAQVSVTKRARASARGSFSVGFSFSVGHCAGLGVVAVGNGPRGGGPFEVAVE